MTYKENLTAILECYFTGFKEEIIDSACNRILEQKPKIGHWIDIDSESFEFYRVYKCSECGNTEIEYPERICSHFKYCPDCGAKMESEVTE